MCHELHAVFGVNVVFAVDFFCELFHQRDHVTKIDLISHVPELHVQDRPWVSEMPELCIVLAKTCSLFFRWLLIVELNNCLGTRHYLVRFEKATGEKAWTD